MPLTDPYLGTRTIMRAVLDALLPDGAAWHPAAGKDFDHLLDGLGDDLQTVTDFLTTLAQIREPATTPYLEELEREYGITPNVQLTDAQRRATLAIAKYKRGQPGTITNLQNALDRAGLGAGGYGLTIFANDPAVDPGPYTNYAFITMAGASTALCGYFPTASSPVTAVCGVSGGLWVVNGDVFTATPAYLGCGDTRMLCGYMPAGATQITAECGYYITLTYTPVVVPSPADSWSWPLVFFIAQSATHLALFSIPWGIAVDSSGHIYATDYGNHRIVRMNNISGAGWTTLGMLGSGTNQFNSPAGIAVDSSGNIYVADSGNNRIVKMTDISGAGWTTLGTLGTGTNQFHSPYGIAVDASANIYVADTGNSRIVRMTNIAGTGWTTLGTLGSGANQFNWPYGIGVDSTAHIYVADSLNHRIVKMTDITGSGWTTLGTVGVGTNQFVDPSSIAVDSSGHIYVADLGNSRIVKMTDITGAGWTTFGSQGTGKNQLYYPLGVALDSTSDIFITDQNNSRLVQIIDITGTGWSVAASGQITSLTAGSIPGYFRQTLIELILRWKPLDTWAALLVTFA